MNVTRFKLYINSTITRLEITKHNFYNIYLYIYKDKIFASSRSNNKVLRSKSNFVKFEVFIFVLIIKSMHFIQKVMRL